MNADDVEARVWNAIGANGDRITELEVLVREAVACIENNVFVPSLSECDAVQDLLRRLNAAADL